MNIIFMCVLQWSMLDPSQIPMLHWLAVGSILKYCFRGLFLVGLSKNLHWIPLSHITQCGKKIFRENRIQCNFTQICKKKKFKFRQCTVWNTLWKLRKFSATRFFRKNSVKSTFALKPYPKLQLGKFNYKLSISVMKAQIIAKITFVAVKDEGLKISN